MSKSVAPNSAFTTSGREMPEPDFTHLLSLLEAASAEAERLGPAAADIARRLETATSAARSVMGQAGARDEGLRPEDLTTGNDK